MKRRMMSLVLLLCLCVMVLPIGAAATETENPTEAPTEPTNVTREPGWCGEEMTWSYDEEEKCLTITGRGEMDDFPQGAPWAEYKDEAVKILVSDEITYIGAYAFRDFDALETVEFGKDLYEIGREAFCSCDALTAVRLPAGFKVFGEASFMSCKNLKEFHCQGRFPSFRQNCLWDTYAVFYFPAENPWSVELIAQLERAFNGRIEFLSSDGTDPYVPTEATEAPAEPPTEPSTVPETTPPTTEAPTEAVTETTETVTVPTRTEQTTDPVPETTEATAETAPQTSPGEEGRGGKGWIGMVIVGAVAVFLILGAMIVNKGSGGGKYVR